jgi:crotonobetainyl-CoA:carnitine CoA-transferase CaiB-like acyl-CoA transferase
MLINQGSTYLVDASVPQRMGNAHPTVVPYQAFPTLDGHIILAIGNDGQFARFCDVAGLDGCVSDDRFRTNRGRIVNRDALIPAIRAAIAQRSTADWLAALEAVDVPAGPINPIDKVFDDPQVKARQVHRVLHQGAAGPLPVVANPIRMTGHDATAAKAPPLLGEDTLSVLQDVLGLDAHEIAQLQDRKVV